MFEFVGQVVDTAHFLVKKRHVGQVTNRGEASRTKKMLVRCWSGDEKQGRFSEYVGQVTVKSGDRLVICSHKCSQQRDVGHMR